MRGYQYPLEVDSQTGSLKLVSGSSYIKSQVRSVLDTVLGERMGYRDLGVSLELFRPTLASRVAKQIQTSLEKYVPVQASVRASLGDSGELAITVAWAWQGEEDFILVRRIVEA